MSVRAERENRLTAILGGTVLGPAFVGSVPILRHQADHRFAPVIGLPECFLPPFARRDTGMNIKIEEDLIDEAGFSLLKPGLRAPPPEHCRDWNGLRTPWTWPLGCGSAERDARVVHYAISPKLAADRTDSSATRRPLPVFDHLCAAFTPVSMCCNDRLRGGLPRGTSPAMSPSPRTGTRARSQVAVVPRI